MARLDFENEMSEIFGLVFRRRESSLAGACARAQLSTVQNLGGTSPPKEIPSRLLNGLSNLDAFRHWWKMLQARPETYKGEDDSRAILASLPKDRN